jgi:2-methylisocitrate lyase-like PEP mutase family enzyme
MSKQTQAVRARAFAALHRSGDPLMLVNVWDAASAAVVAEAGYPALATSSYSVAEAAGYSDGQELPVAELATIVARISAKVDLPLSVDIEAGFGDDPETVERTVAAMLDAGAIGINLEAGLVRGRRMLVDPPLHRAKVAAARRAGEQAGVPLFINARVDTFLLTGNPDEETMNETLRRAAAYRDAGADGIFVPGLIQPAWIERIVGDAGLPLNIMVSKNTPPVVELAALGVARISLAVWPFEFVRAGLRKAVGEFSRTGEFAIFFN